MEMEDNNKKYSCWHCGCNTKHGNIGWGLFFVILGGYLVAQDLGYISSSLSVWPVIVLAFGAYLFVRGLR